MFFKDSIDNALCLCSIAAFLDRSHHQVLQLRTSKTPLSVHLKLLNVILVPSLVCYHIKMRIRFLVFLLASFLASCRAAVVTNAFDQSFPEFFFFSSRTTFFWRKDQETDLTGLFVVGNTNTSEQYPLPRSRSPMPHLRFSLEV